MNLNLAKMLAMKVIRFEGGSISIYDRGMVIMPAEMIIKFKELIGEKIGAAEAEKLMFEAGEFQTMTGSKRYIDKKKELRPVFQKVEATGDPSIEMGREVLKMTGMGETKIVEITKDFNKIVVSTANSPIALEYLKTRGKSDKPVCHYLRGIMSGVIAASGQAGYDSSEVRCKATGISNECVFEFVRKQNKPA